MSTSTPFAPAPPSDVVAEDPTLHSEPSPGTDAVIDLGQGVDAELDTGSGSRAGADAVARSTLGCDLETGSVPAAEPGRSIVDEPEGDGLDWCAAEDLHVLERLVVADRWGRFTPGSHAPTVGQEIVIGQPVGTVGDTPVCSAFSGTVAGWFAVPGEQVRTAQPLLWLRVAS